MFQWMIIMFHCWLVVWNIFIVHFIYGMSSFPLTNSYFSRLFFNRFNHQPALIGYLQYPIVSPTKNPIVFPSVMTTSVEDVRNPTFSLLEVPSNTYIYIYNPALVYIYMYSILLIYIFLL